MYVSCNSIITMVCNLFVMFRCTLVVVVVFVMLFKTTYKCCYGCSCALVLLSPACDSVERVSG